MAWAEGGNTKSRARVEIFYFGCCPWNYFFAYGGGFLDKEWTKTGDDFREELRKLGVEVNEFNLFEHPERAKKHARHIDPYNPFSSYTCFLINEKEVTEEEFFKSLHGLDGKSSTRRR